MKPKQKLLNLQDDEGGKCVIRRGPSGDGYQLFMTDNVNKHCREACFPVDQDYVAEEFSKQGLVWIRE